MINILLVSLIVVGLLFVYYVFFSSTATNSNQENMNNKLKIINYNTNWCGYSKRFQPIWNEFTNKMKSLKPDVDVIDMKCDNESNESKCRVPEVEGYPTVVLYDGDKPNVFNGERSVDNLINFVNNYSK